MAQVMLLCFAPPKTGEQLWPPEHHSWCQQHTSRLKSQKSQNLIPVAMVSHLGELPKPNLSCSLGWSCCPTPLQCTADDFQLPLCFRAVPQSDSSLRELVPPLFTLVSAYTLAPWQPDKEFLVMVIAPMPNNLSEGTVPSPGPSAGVQADETALGVLLGNCLN